jgi:transposase-like protein
MDRGLMVAETVVGVAESGGERSEPEESAGARPDPEVVAKAKRRRFTAEYKLRILRAADRCEKPGELGALLRREGLYSSHLAKWREQRSTGLSPRQRGRKAKDEGAAKRLAQLERENERLRKQLRQSEVIIEAQKKLSRLLEEIHQDAKSS